MKKIIALLLVLTLAVFAFAACGGDSDKGGNDKGNPVADYVKENKDEIIEGFAGGFEQSGVTAEYSVKASGNDIILTVCIDGVNDLPDEQKDIIADAYESLGDAFAPALEELRETEIAELEKIIFEICEEDGDLIGKIEVK